MSTPACQVDPHSLPATFHELTAEDAADFGRPALIYLDPPETNDALSVQKRRKWIEQRAAPYPAGRHSEYLYRPDVDGGRSGPRILISAVLHLPPTLESYLNSIARRRRNDVRGRAAAKRGYVARPIGPAAESAGIRAIIHSSATRQGRAVAPMFADRPASFDFPEYAAYQDPRYRDICTGVFAPNGALAAYLLGKRVGEHVFYDEIMAHREHERHQVTWLLHISFLSHCLAADPVPRVLHYGPWYSGARPYDADAGLNRWKRKANFRPAYLIHASSSAGSRDPERRC